MEFSVGSFNVKNLIGPRKEYYEYEEFTDEEYAWKKDWLADQLLDMDADIVGFQEIFEEAALREVVAETDARGLALNAQTQPDGSKPYRRRQIFKNIKYNDYGDATLFFAPNINDGAPGERRPGLAMLSRFGFVGTPEIIQDLGAGEEISFGDAGSYRLDRLSRPIIKARVPIGDQIVTVFNCHLKSKLGHFLPDDQGDPADLLRYDAPGRALGSLRSALRRMAEAWVLRREIVRALAAGGPVITMGDYNDSEYAVSSEIIAGENAFKNYSWMRRHDAKHRNDRYKRAENDQIQEAIASMKMHSAERLFVRKSLRDLVYTSAFGGVFESIDQILLSRHFTPEWAGAIGEMEYFTALNDHISDGSHPHAPHNKLASDHGQIIAHMKLY